MICIHSFDSCDHYSIVNGNGILGQELAYQVKPQHRPAAALEQESGKQKFLFVVVVRAGAGENDVVTSNHDKVEVFVGIVGTANY